MASIKIYRKGNYILIEDSATGLLHEFQPDEIFVSKATASATDYSIRSITTSYHDQPLADIQDESGSVYSQAAFESFYHRNTGGQPEDVSTSSSTVKKDATSGASAQLVAANLYRKGVMISNNTADKAYFLLGSGSAVEAQDHVLVADSSIYIGTTEEIQYLTTATSGKITITELS